MIEDVAQDNLWANIDLSKYKGLASSLRAKRGKRMTYFVALLTNL